MPGEEQNGLLARGVAWLQELTRHLDEDSARLKELEARVLRLEESQNKLHARLDAIEEAHRGHEHKEVVQVLEARLAALEKGGAMARAAAAAAAAPAPAAPELEERIARLESTIARALGGAFLGCEDKLPS